MSDDTKRDAAADLAVCAAATPGPWVVVTGGGVYLGEPQCWVGMGQRHQTANSHGWFVEDSSTLSQANATFIATAYEALPHWIERATAAEAEVERLRAALAMSEKFRRRYYEGKLKLYEMADDKITRAVMACLPCSEGPLDSECRELLAEKGGAS